MVLHFLLFTTAEKRKKHDETVEEETKQRVYFLECTLVVALVVRVVITHLWYKSGFYK